MGGVGYAHLERRAIEPRIFAVAGGRGAAFEYGMFDTKSAGEALQGVPAGTPHLSMFNPKDGLLIYAGAHAECIERHSFGLSGTFEGLRIYHFIRRILARNWAATPQCPKYAYDKIGVLADVALDHSHSARTE